MQLEVCIETIQEAKFVNQNECARIEVCSALELDGLTPSYGLIAACSELKPIETHVLIRPRIGNFIYSKAELEIMLSDIEMASRAGAHGVVIGCLTTHNSIDLEACKLVAEKAKIFHLFLSFHRAIDLVTNYQESLNILQNLGFQRILSSGQKHSALEGIKSIQSLVKTKNRTIEIMAGSGINESNVIAFRDIGVDAVHFSIRNKSNQNSQVLFGHYSGFDSKKLTSIQEKLKTHANH
ncbi:MAG: copper homeostasis protein CutC [Bacteroidales bacterium]|nr:copper homeostasis protein CutC [Bacteroidales bacterium]